MWAMNRVERDMVRGDDAWWDKGSRRRIEICDKVK